MISQGQVVNTKLAGNGLRDARGQLASGAAGGGDRAAQGRTGSSAADWNATGLLAQRFGITPERAWSLLVRLSQNCHVKVRDIAQALINAHCGRLPSRGRHHLPIQSHLPDGVRLIDAQSQRAPPERTASVIGLDTPRCVDHDRGR